jgi:hypothetical protein
MNNGSLTLNEVESVVTLLGGEEEAIRLLQGELSVSRMAPDKVPVWKTVTLGKFRNFQEYLREMKVQQFTFLPWPSKNYGNLEFPCASVETEIDLVVLSAGYFLPHRSWGIDPEKEIFPLALEQGFELCPAEAGPALRLQYRASSLHDRNLEIAMSPLQIVDGIYGKQDTVFSLCDPGLGSSPMLSSQNPRAGFRSTRFVFVKPRK